MNDKIETNSSEWKWLIEMKKEYALAKSIFEKRIIVKSLIDGKDIGQIILKGVSQ